MPCSLTHDPARAALLAQASRVCSTEAIARCWAWLGLTDAGAALLKNLRQDGALHDLSEGGFTTLAHVIRCEPAAAQPEDLCTILDLPRSAVSALLGRLEVSGLIVRECPDRAHRTFAIRATQAGRQALTSAVQHHLDSILRTMAILEPEDITTLDRICNRLRQASPSAPSL